MFFQMCTMQCPMEALVEIEPRLHRQNPNELHWKAQSVGQNEREELVSSDQGGETEKDDEPNGVDSWKAATVGRLERVRVIIILFTNLLIVCVYRIQ